MAVAAHPGDALFTMGAAVARQVSTGGRGIFLNLTHGERGNPAIAEAEYGAMQVSANDKAAKILGAETAYLSYPDGELPDNEEARFAVCDAIRQHQTHMRDLTMVDEEGRTLVTLPASFASGEVEIERGDLSRILYEAARSDA